VSSSWHYSRCCPGAREEEGGETGCISPPVLVSYADKQQKSAKLVGMSFTICQNCKLLMSKKDHIFG
jgi:hypothetical protein